MRPKLVASLARRPLTHISRRNKTESCDDHHMTKRVGWLECSSAQAIMLWSRNPGADNDPHSAAMVRARQRSLVQTGRRRLCVPGPESVDIRPAQLLLGE